MCFVIIKLIFSHAWMHSHTHNSVTIWIYVLSYGFNWPDVISITLHILILSDTGINAFIHITDEVL